MKQRLRSESGFSLPELLMAMTLMLVILGATLTTLDGFGRNVRLDERRSEAQESLRRGIDHLERQLRNLATPAPGMKSIGRAHASDLIFQTADPQKRWVRYCIDPSDPLIAGGGASLWYQVSVDASTAPPATSCPETTGWSSTTSAGQSVVNAGGGLNRPVFFYNWPKDTTGNDVTTDTSTITRIRTQLWVDTNPGANPVEQRLASGVFLRNQNQVPVADFTWTPNGHGVVLNGSPTSDPERRRLEYHWYYGDAPAIPSGCKPPSPAPSSYLGSGIVLSATFTAATPSPQSVTLCAVDPGGLTATIAKPVTFS